jgi:hypothetical protein
MAKRIYLVTGDRLWDCGEDSASNDAHQQRMAAVFKRLVPGSIVLQGGASGADKRAEILAKEHKMFPMTMPYAGFLGRGGGAARNRKMLAVMVGLREAGWAAKVLAFHDDLANSRGTLDMVRIAIEQSFSATLISIISAQTLRSSKELRKLLKG